MNRTTNQELIAAAVHIINPHHLSGDRLMGDVAAALVTENGTVFSGVCIDTGSGTGFCAEHSAIAAMVTAREYKIAKIVAVWRDDNGIVYVLSPCGRCREFIRQIDQSNLNADVILAGDATSKLSELLPAHAWPQPFDPQLLTRETDA